MVLVWFGYGTVSNGFRVVNLMPPPDTNPFLVVNADNWSVISRDDIAPYLSGSTVNIYSRVGGARL